MAQQYIGVYATNERSPAVGDFLRPLGTRKRLWFVWEMPEDNYKVQPLNAAHQPMAEPRIVTSKEFTGRFTPEPNCFLAPEGTVHPEKRGVDAASAEFPDLFESALCSLSSLPSQADSGGVVANDPKLLLQWAKGERRPKIASTEPVKISFDRLVGEVSSIGSAENESLSDEAMSDVVPKTEGEAILARQLRSRFVQALLLLRRGARAEGVVLLESILKEPYSFFDGGAQLFSEIGLGLRRLGFATLALAAHRRALEFEPHNERVLFNLARSCHDLGLLIEARDYLRHALEVDPTFSAAEQFLAFLEVEDVPTEEE